MARYRIAPARPADLPLIPAIERAAAVMLSGHAPPEVLAETTSRTDLENLLRAGRLWTARDGEEPVGFAYVKVIEPGRAHLDEIDVDPRHGRRGLGTRLVRAVCAWAATHAFEAVTLRTFRDVPWNMPFYARLGFDVLTDLDHSAALRAVVEDEARRGLDPRRRVTMRRWTDPVVSASCPPSSLAP